MKKPVKGAVLAHLKRGLAFAVAVTVTCTSADFTALAIADESEINPIEIDHFESLDSEIAYQQITVGSSEADIVFPDSLRAFKNEVNNEEGEPADEQLEEEPIVEDPATEVPAVEDPAAGEGEDNGEAVEEGSSDEGYTEEPAEGEFEEEIIDEEIIEEEIIEDSSDDNIIARFFGKFFHSIFDSFSSTTALAADTDEVNIANVNWVIDEERSDAAELSTTTSWLRYVYVPEIPSYYVTEAALPTITVDVVGGEVLGEVRTTATDDDDASFQEDPAPTKDYSYKFGSGARELDLFTVLENTSKLDGSEDNKVINKSGDTDGTKYEIVGDPELSEGSSQYFTLQSSDNPETNPSGWSIKALKGYKDTNIKLTVNVKNNNEPDIINAVVTLTADYDITVTLKDGVKFVYNTKPQELKASDVVVKIDGGDALTPVTDYTLTNNVQTDHSDTDYDFNVVFSETSEYKNETAKGKWNITPVPITVTFDNYGSAKGAELLGATNFTYKVTCADTTNFPATYLIPNMSIKTNADKDTAGTYDIFIENQGSLSNYEITQNKGIYYVLEVVQERTWTCDNVEYGNAPKPTKPTGVTISPSYDGKNVSISSYQYKLASASDSDYETKTEDQLASLAVGTYDVRIAYKVYPDPNSTATEKTVNSIYLYGEPKTFEVTPINLSSFTMTVTSKKYKAEEYDVLPTTITFKGKTLTYDKDYTASGEYSEEDAGSYKFKIKGKGNYSGETAYITWTITPVSLDLATIKSPSVSNNAKVTQTRTKEGTPRTITCTIPYTSEKVTLSVEELSLEGFDEPLEKDVDFTISNEDYLTIAAGKAATADATSSFKINGKGNFTGTINVIFKVSKGSSSKGAGNNKYEIKYNKSGSGVTNNTSAVDSTGFKSYAVGKSTNYKYILNIDPVSHSNISTNMSNAVANMGNDDALDVDYFDITVKETGTDSDGSTVNNAIHDLSSPIDIVMSIGSTNASRSIYVLREHDGQIVNFTKLDSTPTTYTDGTYYVNPKTGKLYIYSRYFSNYAVVYSSIEKTSASDNGVYSGGRAPQTGDNLPNVLVWSIILLAGVALVGFSAFELKRLKKGELKKKS